MESLDSADTLTPLSPPWERSAYASICSPCYAGSSHSSIIPPTPVGKKKEIILNVWIPYLLSLCPFLLYYTAPIFLCRSAFFPSYTAFLNLPIVTVLGVLLECPYLKMMSVSHPKEVLSVNHSQGWIWTRNHHSWAVMTCFRCQVLKCRQAASLNRYRVCFLHCWKAQSCSWDGRKDLLLGRCGLPIGLILEAKQRPAF